MLRFFFSHSEEKESNAVQRLSFSPVGEEARLRGTASRADERPSAAREGRNEEVRCEALPRALMSA
jgi:hypothetical protein